MITLLSIRRDVSKFRVWNYSVKRIMSVFTETVNPITGACDWEMQDDEYDFHQEIARSSYADMLYDTERNQKYEAAIKIAIDTVHGFGKEANVLDIGTGTGLLSMMAAKHGADRIIACEAFEPIGKCAEEVVEKNGFASKIKVVKKRSTELKVGVDLPYRFNILVTEVFDTELIGEGAVCTFNHAHSELLESDAIVVPNSATVYAQVVESELVSNWNKLRDFKFGQQTSIKIPDFINNCAGAAAVHDVQLSQLPLQSFRSITSPLPVLKFDFSGKTRIREREESVVVFKASVTGTAQAVFMWWDLVMDPFSQITLSCAPYWAHPDVKVDISGPEAANLIPWRDHWMQAIYYLPSEVPVQQNHEFSLVSSHDEFSLWFSVTSSMRVQDDGKFSNKPICTCGLHLSMPRARIGCLNDTLRRKKYYRALQKKITQDTICLCLSDLSLLSLMAASLNPKKVYYLDTNVIFTKTLEKIIEHNNLQNKIQIFNKKEDLLSICDKVNLIVGEPHFSSSTLPWHNLQFWHLATQFRQICSDNVSMIPYKVVFSGLVVQFDHLWKIQAPLKTVEGFNTEPFDKLINNAIDLSDNAIDAQPLWEYGCRALSAPFQVLQIDLGANVSVSDSGFIHCLKKGTCHGVVLWADWCLDDLDIISTGPLDLINEKLVWDKYTKQGVFFFPQYKTVSHSNKISYLSLFQHKIPDVSFEFSLS
ncbi:unnamed protein product [Bemisia tabaci]|uniref:Protein arginine N-methyltransferase n=2 Tax=Bemisia tabaci TaxID=7038 RepID=A0A9N9ZZX8_BEMTA|nr:unnamed protein product [Bemisia tabaci]